MVRTRFAELMADDQGDLPLDEAALEIAARLQPDLDRIGWMVALDTLAAECPTPTAPGIGRFLFRDEYFVGNRAHYTDWRNSCLDHVLATRTGIPITLSIVMIEVARRVGVDLVGVGMPAHFIVGSPGEANDGELDVFYDPFGGGTRLDRAGARGLFDDITGGQVRWQDSYLDPTAPRDIVIRMLNNLAGITRARGDRLRLAMVMSLRAEVPELVDEEGDEITAALSAFN